jgi:ribosomal protein S12 methylthiotransferase accessory factor
MQEYTFFDIPFANRALQRFFSALETRFNVTITPRKVPDTLHLLIRSMQQKGIVSHVHKIETLPDEPRYYAWSARYAHDDSASGSSATSDSSALLATLAEAQERYLWRNARDTIHTLQSTELLLQEPHIPLDQFAGFSPLQRRKHSELSIDTSTSFEWINTLSLTEQKEKYIPLQTASATYNRSEPLIRPVVTTGLATHETRERAILAGVLEIIERDAYMITWLNQLIPNRIDIGTIARTDEELETLIEECARYHLEVDVVRLVTDAPAYCVAAILTDKTIVGPKIVLGLGCHTQKARAVSHSIAEALRIRHNLRVYWMKKYTPESITPHHIHHVERAVYWLTEERAHRLSFLTQGPQQPLEDEPWEYESTDQHLHRVVTWCKERHYDLLVANLGTSSHNVTPWHIYSVVLPQLQPMHLSERFPCTYGKRLTNVPKLCGYTPAPTPFTSEPHPFV